MSTAHHLPAAHVAYAPREYRIEAARASRSGALSGFFVLLGRALFASIFLMAPLSHFSAPTIAYAAQHGVPDAGLIVPAAGVVAGLGGLSILLGLQARIGALLIILFLVPVSLTMHAFWLETNPVMAGMQQAMFMKNVAMLGGALLIAHFGAGPWSFDGLRRRAVSN
jgi:putative oxidoreductase